MKLLALVAALALPSLALADDPKTTKAPITKTAPSKLADEDIKLIAHVHAVHLMEMDMGKLGAARSTSAVKKFATELANDHQEADKDLIALAKTKGLAKIPADVPATEAAKTDHDAMMAKVAEVKKTRGAEFDRLFLALMVSGHDTEIGRLDAAMSGIKDTDLQAKMKDLRPVLQRHADAARDLQKNAPTASMTPPAARK